MSNRRLPIVAVLLSLSLAATSWADAPTTRPTPIRIVTVDGSGNTSYPTGDVSYRKRAELESYEAALADAKDRATRAAKVLSVTLGPPIIVETTASDDGTGFSPPPRRPEFTVNVKITFELREP